MRFWGKGCRGGWFLIENMQGVGIGEGLGLGVQFGTNYARTSVGLQY